MDWVKDVRWPKNQSRNPMNFKTFFHFFFANRLRTILFLLALFLLGSAWISIGNILRVIQCEQEVGEAHQIIRQIQKVGALTVDIETGYRGFTLSGQSKYLEPMTRAQEELPVEIDRLRALTAGDLFQQQRVQTVEGLIAEKAELGRQIVEDREKSKTISTVLLIATSQGKAVMDRIRRLLDEMTAMAEARLQQRQAEAQVSTVQTIWFYVATVVLSLLFLGLGFNLLEKNHKNRLELMNYSRKLEASNQNLQDFIHVAVHDLKEPLRKISLFGSFLKTEIGEAMPPGAAEYLFKMQDGAQRMHVLIDGLIQLTYVTTQAKPFGRVDLSVILKEVQSDLEIRLKECGGRVETGPLPSVEADAAQMRQLFQNLLGNALKYRKADTAPVVRVAGEADVKTGKARLWVRDNGIGFDQNDAKKIFNIFQRLDTAEKFEGTGIGLAICRKVVERHNGTITAQSQPGQGATFEIVLPLRQKN